MANVASEPFKEGCLSGMRHALFHAFSRLPAGLVLVPVPAGLPVSSVAVMAVMAIAVAVAAAAAAAVVVVVVVAVVVAVVEQIQSQEGGMLVRHVEVPSIWVCLKIV